MDSSDCSLDLLEQTSLYIKTLYLSAESLLRNQHPYPWIQLHALSFLKRSTLSNLNSQLDNTSIKAELFADQTHPQNIIFCNYHQKITSFLKNYSLLVAQLSQQSLKVLYQQNQKLCSRFRARHQITFQLENSRKKPQHFSIDYIPCLTFSSQQAQFMPTISSRKHYTSSHHENHFQLGNRNMLRVRLCAHSNKNNTTIYQGFSGPASRVPYECFETATPEQKMLIRAITVLNQTEIIEILAKHPLAKNKKIIEQYTQVISPLLEADDDFEKEQFDYSRFAIELMEHRYHPVKLKESSPPVYKYFEGRFGCWGVNKYRNIEANNVLQLSLEQANHTCLAKLFVDVYRKNSLLKNILKPYWLPCNILLSKIKKLELELLPQKVLIQNKLIDYYRKYQKPLSQVPPIITIKVQADLKQLEQLIENYQIKKKSIDTHYQNLYQQQQKLLLQNASTLTSALNNTNNLTQYNSAYLLLHAFELQKNDLWLEPQNNYKLPTIICSLATILKHHSTKGCKSNNNRGQRLMQKILGFHLTAELYNDGKFDVGYLDKKYQAQLLAFDAAHLKMQALHYQANLGVGGGKCKIVDTDNFSDNGLWAKIAKWSKFHKMQPPAPSLIHHRFFTADITPSNHTAIVNILTGLCILSLTLSINLFVICGLIAITSCSYKVYELLGSSKQFGQEQFAASPISTN